MPKIETNKFGSGEVFSTNEIPGPVYILCSACMSAYAECLSWANANPQRIGLLCDASSIVVNCCQVTDLAVLNDFRMVEMMHKKYPNARIYVTGCLSRRFDIALPEGTMRMERMVSDYESLDDMSLVKWQAPFWVKGFDEKDGNPLSDGMFLRKNYPLRIGVGCHGRCSYCTINETRGACYELDPNDQRQIDQMYRENVVLVADSPSAKLLDQYIGNALRLGTHLSIRNVEPGEALRLTVPLVYMATEGLLDAFHCPVQSLDIPALGDMGRSAKAVMDLLGLVEQLKGKGVVCATNVILDYKGFPNTREKAAAIFDNVVWNPYWDGKWDRNKAEERFTRYIG